MKIVVAIAVVIVVFLLLVVIIRKRVKQRDEIIKRMEYFSGVGQRGGELGGLNQSIDDVPKVQEEPLKERILKAVQELSSKMKAIRNTSFADRMDIKMQQAAWPLLGSEFVTLLIVLAVAGGAFAGLLTLKIPVALMGAVGVDILAMVILDIRISKRRKAFTNQMGDMLNMVANALRSGFSFIQAFELVAKEMNDPVRGEVNKVVREIGVGVSLEKALENMNKRICSPEFDLVVTAVIIQRQVGGNMAQILDNISNTINERIRMRREVMALTAQGRASGVVLAALPFGAAFLLSVINPGYLDPLIDTGTGRMAIAGGMVMEIIGWLCIEKIVNIEM
jgi:tight adherence protein B